MQVHFIKGEVKYEFMSWIVAAYLDKETAMVNLLTANQIDTNINKDDPDVEYTVESCELYGIFGQ